MLRVRGCEAASTACPPLPASALRNTRAGRQIDAGACHGLHYITPPRAMHCAGQAPEQRRSQLEAAPPPPFPPTPLPPAECYHWCVALQVCTACPAGRFSKTDGSVWCPGCPAGTFNSYTSAKTCRTVRHLGGRDHKQRRTLRGALPCLLPQHNKCIANACLAPCLPPPPAVPCRSRVRCRSARTHPVPRKACWQCGALRPSSSARLMSGDVCKLISCLGRGVMIPSCIPLIRPSDGMVHPDQSRRIGSEPP